MNSQILLIDNYDSFTYNLVHLIEMLHGEKPLTLRVDEVNSAHITNSQAVVISPGPGLPNEMGHLMELVQLAINTKPVLGVCLGHQAIAEAYGGKLNQLAQVYHGIAREAQVEISIPMYRDCPKTFEAGSYHSWTASDNDFPKELIVTARDNQREILSFIHESKPIWGVQYHPESILTPQGPTIVRNWLDFALK
ncbi:MAG TPA: aminodeoxychorismate/anthranilate synthase component II [Flavobacteriales bacterium]|nr:aminodeoxychorismate/anthranilate synthase component II [Flavobacteriales bacterium]HPH81536.1 aminodeoxychorismate/anthranilate synthase component II [Flavobacteriales bacterium]